jgi:hypothetical protein
VLKNQFGTTNLNLLFIMTYLLLNYLTAKALNFYTQG